MRKANITVELVAELVGSQFPQWAELPVVPVDQDGWDNSTFRLGPELSVRLPSAEYYVPQIDKEHQWLPVLAPKLPLEIPVPVAKGRPGVGYPWPWSVYRWLDGETAVAERLDDPTRLAGQLAEFLTALYGIDTTGGPAAGPHNFFRGGSVSTYDHETRQALDALEGVIDTALATRVWEEALAARAHDRDAWVHGDVAPTNLLVVDGDLRAVIDWGCVGVGDPACDLMMAWTFFEGAARDEFRDGLGFDAATWTRGRGWTLWKALTAIVRDGGTLPHWGWRLHPREVLDEVLADDVVGRRRAAR